MIEERTLEEQFKIDAVTPVDPPISQLFFLVLVVFLLKADRLRFVLLDALLQLFTLGALSMLAFGSWFEHCCPRTVVDRPKCTHACTDSVNRTPQSAILGIEESQRRRVNPSNIRWHNLCGRLRFSFRRRWQEFVSRHEAHVVI